MKVLIEGAGVIGCYLAHVLCEAGQDVTLLARGAWREQLAQNGLSIQHRLQRKMTVDRPRIVGRVDDQPYDVAFAVMQHQQMWAVLDDLAQCSAPIVVLVGNNMSASEMEAHIHANAVAAKTVLFGFQLTAGRRENGQVICARFGAGTMSIGGLHEMPSDGVRRQIAALFAGSRYRLTWVDNMDAWYKCHLAFILPVAYLGYATGCNLRRASRAQRKCLLDAASEGYALLKALDYPIRPVGDDQYCEPGVKRMAIVVVLFVMAKTVIGDLAASDHCRHAVTEMEGLDAAFEALRQRKPDFEMPNWDKLRASKPSWDQLHRQYDGLGK